MRVAALVALLLAAPLLAGCAEPDAPTTGTNTATGTITGATGTGGPKGNASAPLLGAPRELQLFLTADGGLAPTVGADGAVAAGMPATGFVTGVKPVRFVTAPFDHAVLVTPAAIPLALHVRANAPQPSNTIFDIGAWVGTTEGSSLMAIGVHPAALTPGTVHRYDLEVGFGTRPGWFIPEGGALTLEVVTDAGREAATTSVLVGNSTPSSLTVTVQDYSRDPLAGASPLPGTSEAGQAVQGANPVACDLAPGVTSKDHAIEVPADAVLLLVAVAAAGPMPAYDIDLALRDGADVIGSTVSPHGHEQVLLAADTLAPYVGKTLTAHVYVCGTGVVDYTIATGIAVRPLAAAPPSPRTPA